MIERIVSLIHRVIDPLKRFAAGPYAVVAAIGLALLIGAVALRERDARLRASLELKQLKSETAARVKDLEERGAEALRAANQRNSLVIRELEASRLKLAQQGEKLRQHLAALERDERVRVERVATLPSQELAERVAARLDADAGRTGVSGLGTGHLGKAEPLLSDVNSIPARPHSGKEDASPQHPAPGPEAAGTPPLQQMTLDTDAMRKAETAFVELDSCRAQAAVKDQQVANCREQLNSSAAIAQRLDDSVRQLNEAVRLKDEILARREAEYRAELKAARGSRWDRFRKAVTYVAVGVVAGVVLAR